MKKLSLKTIERQIAALTKKAKKLQTVNKKPALRQIAKLMKKNDITLDDLRSVASGRGTRGVSKLKGRKAKPLYRNPKTGETWSGRGRAARWIVAAEKAGRKRTEFLIKKA